MRAAYSSAQPASKPVSLHELLAFADRGVAAERQAATFANSFEPDGDVDAITQDVLALDQYVSEIDADAIKDVLSRGRRVVALRHHLVD